MNPNRIIEPEKIQILQIRTKKGNIEGGGDGYEHQIGGHTFNFEIGTGLNTEKNIFGIELSIEITALNQQETPTGATGAYTHEIVFSIENLNEFIETGEQTGQPKVDGLLVGTLMGIAYSTIRGIIFTRTQGTPLGVVVLPVLDPKKLLEMAGTRQPPPHH